MTNKVKQVYKNQKKEHEPLLSSILTRIRFYYTTFVVFPKEYADVMAPWVLHTHIYEHFEFTPYLNICSAEPKSGKTLVLEITEILVSRGKFISGTTASSLIRNISSTKPTMLMDEVDQLLKGKGNEDGDLGAILNSGFKYNGNVTKSEMKGNGWESVDYSSYCPKAMSSIGLNVLQEATQTRCIFLLMYPKSKEESKTVKPFRRKQRRELDDFVASLKQDIATYIKQQEESETPVWELDVDLPEDISDRDADICEPLYQITAQAGGTWDERFRKSIHTLLGSKTIHKNRGRMLLENIYTISLDYKPNEFISTTNLIDELCHERFDASGWGTYRKNALPIIGRQIINLLKPYKNPDTGEEIRPERQGGGGANGYYFSQFDDAFKRMEIKASVEKDKSSTSSTSNTPVVEVVEDLKQDGDTYKVTT